MNDGYIVIDPLLFKDGPGCCFCGGDLLWPPLSKRAYRVACKTCSQIFHDYGIEGLKEHLANLTDVSISNNTSIEVDDYL